MEVKLYTEYIKLAALLKYTGLCSTGGEADIHIEQGEVTYNGEVCLVRGKKVYPGDVVGFGNETVHVK